MAAGAAATGMDALTHAMAHTPPGHMPGGPRCPWPHQARRARASTSRSALATACASTGKGMCAVVSP